MGELLAWTYASAANLSAALHMLRGAQGFPAALPPAAFLPASLRDHDSYSARMLMQTHLWSLLQVNPRYVPQLQTVLTWPHSIGIVGGRPSSSLYFVGCQGDNVLFLDPHDTQQVRL